MFASNLVFMQAAPAQEPRLARTRPYTPAMARKLRKQQERIVETVSALVEQYKRRA